MMHPSYRPRDGFTLLELLVAAGVFLFGFVAAYSMFLTAVRNRQLADSITRSSLASTSVIAEIRMRAGREQWVPGGHDCPIPAPPSYYIGDGFADNGAELAQNDRDGFMRRYPDQPGVWYRVVGCSDLIGGDDAKTVAIKLRLAVLHMPVATAVLEAQGGTTWLSLDFVRQRFRIEDDLDAAETIRALAARDAAQVYDAVIHRHPSWMP